MQTRERSEPEARLGVRVGPQHTRGSTGPLALSNSHEKRFSAKGSVREGVGLQVPKLMAGSQPSGLLSLQVGNKSCCLWVLLKVHTTSFHSIVLLLFSPRLVSDIIGHTLCSILPRISVTTSL